MNCQINIFININENIRNERKAHRKNNGGVLKVLISHLLIVLGD